MTLLVPIASEGLRAAMCDQRGAVDGIATLAPNAYLAEAHRGMD